MRPMSDAGASNEPHVDPREELRLIDEEIEKLRQELAGLRDDLRDWDDSGTATRLIEEQEAVIEALERRRRKLLERREQG
jgi:chromosome segregation ATPase